MIFNINAGHNIGEGAIGIKDESIENRKVKDEVIRLLKEKGHIVYDTTVDKSKNNLYDICEKCNSKDVDLNVFIHFNAYNGKVEGTEVLIYNNGSDSYPYAERILKNISGLGFVNRGIKQRPKLYVLRNTEKPSLLVECAFIDNKHDMGRYKVYEMARAIVEGLIDEKIEDEEKVLYRVVTNTYSNKENAEKEVEELKKKGYPSSFIIIV